MPIEGPFEYLTFGGTFGRTFTMFGDRLDYYMAITGIVWAPMVIFFVTLAIVTSIWDYDYMRGMSPKHIPLAIMVYVIEAFCACIITLVGRGAIVHAVAHTYIGQTPTVQESLVAAWQKKWVLFGSAALIFGAVVVVGFIMAIMIGIADDNSNFFTITLAVLVDVPAFFGTIYAFVGLVLTNPAIIVETLPTPFRAMNRSWEISSGSRCYIFCALACLWILDRLLARLLRNMFAPRHDEEEDAGFIVAYVIVNWVPYLIFFPLIAIMESVMYLNLRIGRESMNHQVLAGDLTSEASPAARFRTDDTPQVTGLAASASMDYRHVPLMEDEENAAK